MCMRGERSRRGIFENNVFVGSIEDSGNGALVPLSP